VGNQVPKETYFGVRSLGTPAIGNALEIGQKKMSEPPYQFSGKRRGDLRRKGVREGEKEKRGKKKRKPN